MELISVIVPVYNVEQYLDRCIDSIRNQTHKNLEIILVDDGSPDQSPQMCDAFSLEDSRIRVIHKENEGLGNARNSGLEIANGDYVTFVDSDDWISADHLQNLYCIAREHNADAVIGSNTRVRSDGTVLPRKRPSEETLFVGEEIVNNLILTLIGAAPDSRKDLQIESSSCMCLYRMDCIRKHSLRFLSERIVVGEDLFFNLDFYAQAERVVMVNELGYFYFENLNSITSKYDPKRTERTIRFYHALSEWIEHHTLTERVGHRLERTYLLKIRVAIRNIVCSELPFDKKLGEIRTILNHEITKKILTDYPIETLAPGLRVLAILMRLRSVFGVYCLMKFREGAEQHWLLSPMLKKCGINR